MKFLIVGDLHGQKPKIHFKDFDAIIAPGDFCSDKPRKYMFEAIMKNSKNPDNKTRWYEIVGKAKAKKMIQKSLKDGRKILEFLNSFNVPVFLVPGNWDWTPEKSSWKPLTKDYFKNNLLKGLKNIKNVYHKKISYKGFNFIGHGITSSPEIPQKKSDPKKIDKKKLQKIKKDYQKTFQKLAKLFEKAKKSKNPTIFLSHNVPFNTKLDTLINPSLPMHGRHNGSLISRKLIEIFQPLICIGGHMHEHFGKAKIRKTIVVNAGFGKNVNTLLETRNGKINNLKFWRGK